MSEETVAISEENTPVESVATSESFSEEEKRLMSKKYLKTRDYALFSLARFASSAVTGLIQGYLLFFYTSCVGINANAVGIMFLISKIFDGLNDPIMGVIVDKTRTKWGKMRPYLVIGAIPWGVITILMFLPQIYAGMSMSGKIVYMYITYILYGLLGTIIGIPLDGIDRKSVV